MKVEVIFKNILFINKIMSLLVLGLENGNIEIFDSESFECLNTIEDHKEYFWGVVSILLSPDNTKILSSSGQKIKIWNTITCELIHILEGHIGNVYSICFSHDGSKILSGSLDGKIKMWNSETYECLLTLHSHNSYISSVLFNLDDSMIISSSGDKTIAIWDAKSFKLMGILKGHTNSVNSISINFNGSKIVSSSLDKTVRIWSLETYECLYCLNCPHNTYPFSVLCSPNDDRMILGMRNEIIIWDIQLCVALNSFTEHDNYINSISVNSDFSRIFSSLSDSGLFSSPLDKRIKIWNSETGEFKNHPRYRDIIRSACFSHEFIGNYI